MYVYRVLPLNIAVAILDLCEDADIDYEIWNIDEFLAREAPDIVDLGLTEESWSLLERL